MLVIVKQDDQWRKITGKDFAKSLENGAEFNASSQIKSEKIN